MTKMQEFVMQGNEEADELAKGRGMEGTWQQPKPYPSSKMEEIIVSIEISCAFSRAIGKTEMKTCGNKKARGNLCTRTGKVGSTGQTSVGGSSNACFAGSAANMRKEFNDKLRTWSSRQKT